VFANGRIEGLIAELEQQAGRLVTPSFEIEVARH